ncbi:MAG: hypothetical protein IJB73_01260 [Firmicutes bacterium]|nr:hypothetical protein [Bacillota bacterium]
MFTFLDLLVVVFMVIAASGLLASCLMFLTKKPVLRKACFYITSALALYVGYVGVRIGGSLFPVQSAAGIAVGIAAIAAVVMALTGKENEKKFMTARIIAAAALVIGIVNAFLL